ncbi:DNA cytosine methyltransferase [Sphingomonas sp. BK069]|uniref:DNA cytosine methyltransferase n=1 Tax=Sphingomonas sp. BK069 TaxID=2586979 RepID=UPI00160DA385|nr:DNA cytosine methyltransferase [Sphingomonas sp. BK069]MBB3349823.1 site-specific DNA-cytosine methylase [Sphingomonas sp. BK069]
MSNADPDRNGTGALMERVRATIAARRLSHKDAAALIGVGKNTLEDHLAGEHVRSDSAEKYRSWLAGRQRASNVFVLPSAERELDLQLPGEESPPPPSRPRLVVDIFSGCGGLSLGFDLLEGGSQFRTVLALDNQVAPIATLNRNAAALGHGERAIGRVVDLTEFLNATEFLAFYLQHAGEALDDAELQAGLRTLDDGAFLLFLDEIARTDRAFVERLNAIRSTPNWAAACGGLNPRAVDQTSVGRFHDALRLPRPSRKVATLPPLLWSAPTPERASPASPGGKDRTDQDWIAEVEAEWDAEVELLAGRREGDGRGQLTASARRVGAFADFLATDAMQQVRAAWIEWRARREWLRASLFCDARFASGLRRLYERAQVAVLVGGPPCQGFSRIGRGKIRSLREARIQAHPDTEAGDARNRLFQQYVTVLSALRPDVFLFENVAHFRSVVRVDGAAFQATELLKEAIERVSHGETRYEVAQEVIDASRHGVPQTRQRYFMAGVLTGRDAESSTRLAAACLELRRDREAPLALALAGLPAPGVAGGDGRSTGAMDAQHALDHSDADAHAFSRWVRQPRPGTKVSPVTVDAHVCRAPRSDDAALFALMGPGRRWMDYRAEQANTSALLAGLVDALLDLSDDELGRLGASATGPGRPIPGRDALLDLRSRIDGALPLRLLLEQIGARLGTPHHLLEGGYIAKKESNHGDWLARLDASRPSKTMTSHMSKDTYAYVHPSAPRTLSVREAARVQTFPDWFAFGGVALTEAFKMIGNAVPPMISGAIATRVAVVLHRREVAGREAVARQRG